MSRDSQQLIRLVETLFRSLRGKVPLPWAIGLAALLVGYLIAQPHLEGWLGVPLPGLGSRGTAEPSVVEERSPSKEADSNSPATAEATSVLRDAGRGVLESPAGLRYTRSRQDGHRLNHVLTHARDEPDRVGQHGVFDSQDPTEVVLLIDQAYEQAERGVATQTRSEDGRTIYTVNMGRRIGYVGGQSGDRRGRPAARHLRIVLHGSNVITAYPVVP